MLLITVAQTAVLLLALAGQSNAAVQAPQSNPAPAAGAPQSGASATPDKSSSTTAPKKKPKKSKAGSTASPSKRVVHNGSTPPTEMQLSEKVSQTDASRKREDVTNLLAATDLNMQQLSFRQLTPSDKNVMQQIRTYMNQAKGAVENGDFDSGANLASKANQLSTDLLRH